MPSFPWGERESPLRVQNKCCEVKPSLKVKALSTAFKEETVQCKKGKGRRVILWAQSSKLTVSLSKS